MNNSETKIYVIYLGIAGIRTEDVEEFKDKIIKRIIPQSVDGEFIVIPRQTFETDIKCINPVYITEERLIEEHTLLMDELNKQLASELNNLKNKNEQ